MVDNVVDTVTNGIADKIDMLFEKKYPIYPNKREQGMEKPCFFIKYIDGNESREIGLENNYYKDLLHFDIIGFSKDGDTKTLHLMIDKLYELEFIEIKDGTTLMARKLNPKIEDEVLHFMIDFSIFIKKEIPAPTKMDNFDLKGEIKEDEG